MTRRFIVSGTPGAGKTSIVEELGRRGYAIVSEAATDLIERELARGSESPWTDPHFIDVIAAEQARRMHEPVRAAVQLHDRSLICTLALSHWVGRPIGPAFAAAAERLADDPTVDRRVFFVRPLGFMVPTAVRRITYEDALAFERLHEQVYRSLGFTLIDIAPGSVAERASIVDGHVRTWLGATAEGV